MLELRSRQQRNLLATLLLSQGVPMILHGDELGRTQHGNNNVYCQDDALAWVDWSDGAVDYDLVDFTARLVALRQAHPAFRRRRFFQGHDVRGATAADEIAWLRADGTLMSDDDWGDGRSHTVAVYLNGQALPDVDQRGRPMADDSFLLLMNGNHEPVAFVLPDASFGKQWQVELDTAAAPHTGDGPRPRQVVRPGGTRRVPARSLVLLRRKRTKPT